MLVKFCLVRLFFSGRKKTRELLLKVMSRYTASTALSVCLPFPRRSSFRYAKARQPSARNRLTSRGSSYISAYGDVPMRTLKVALRASLPAMAALNQNRPAAPDSAITVRASSIIESMQDTDEPIIESMQDTNEPFCHCSYASLK